jgi:hypothetical protein
MAEAWLRLAGRATLAGPTPRRFDWAAVPERPSRPACPVQRRNPGHPCRIPSLPDIPRLGGGSSLRYLLHPPDKPTSRYRKLDPKCRQLPLDCSSRLGCRQLAGRTPGPPRRPCRRMQRDSPGLKQLPHPAGPAGHICMFAPQAGAGCARAGKSGAATQHAAIANAATRCRLIRPSQSQAKQFLSFEL